MARILLADDEQATQELVTRALLSDGHDVVAVADGTDALERLRAEPSGFALLISDIQMPGMNGLELAEAVASISPSVGIVLMSGFATSAGASASARIRRMVTKPFSLEEIRKVVREALA